MALHAPCRLVVLSVALCLGSCMASGGLWHPPGLRMRLRGGGSSGDSGSNKRFRYDKAFGGSKKETADKKRGGTPAAAAEGGKESGAAAKMPSKAALYQLTTQLFNPSGAKKQDYYKLLGIDKTATTKQVRDAYYREARKWHPDKNKHDPNAEVRFKQISEANEVLSNPAKRKAYDEGGREGLDAHEAAENIDIKAIVRALFGGGEFDDVMGDAGEIPLLRRMVEKEAEVKDSADEENSTEEDDETKRARMEKERELEELMEKEEAEISLEIGRKLLGRLEGRALGKVDDEVFARDCCEYADTLCRAPGGLDLVKMISKVWLQKGKMYARRMWGLEGMWARVQDLAGKISQGTSLIKGALKASRMTREAMLKGEQAKNASSASVPEDEEQEEKTADEEGEEDAMGGIDKEEMLKIAKVSLDVVWRFGLFLLQGRVRSSVDTMFSLFKNSTHYSREAEPQLALALLDMSRHFRSRYDAALAANTTEMRTGIPIHLDEMEE